MIDMETTKGPSLEPIQDHVSARAIALSDTPVQGTTRYTNSNDRHIAYVHVCVSLPLWICCLILTHVSKHMII